jgi:hypothetical protein
MKKFAIILLAVTALKAEDAVAPNPELDAANARIAILEQALDAMANKSQACFSLYTADMKLTDLLPKVQQAKQQAAQPQPQPQPQPVQGDKK